MKRYLVTGAQGFIGRYFIARLLKTHESIEILGIGRSPRQNNAFTHSIQWKGRRIPAPLPKSFDVLAAKRYQYVPLSLHRRDSLLTVLRGFRPEVVVHLASGSREHSPLLSFRANVDGTIHLLEAIAGACITPERIVIGSTAGVYGLSAELPLIEDAPCNPVDLYSTSRLAAEHASRVLSRQYGLPMAWARFFDLVGPGQDDRQTCGRLIAQAAAILNGHAPPVIDVDSLEATHDVIDVRDAATALACIAENGVPGAVYNVAAGIETSVRATLESTLRVAGLNGRVLLREKPPRSEVPRRFASTLRLRALGFACEYRLGQSVEDAFEYYLQPVTLTAVA
jgi:nucleoside-diphosphate-sugar epimerase